jgi:hypothetical protein
MRFRLSNPRGQRLMTPEELRLLKTIGARGVHQVAPAGTAGGDPSFDRTLAALQRMEQVGWIRLETAVAPPTTVVGAVARCTAEGRRLLVILGH